MSHTDHRIMMSSSSSEIKKVAGTYYYTQFTMFSIEETLPLPCFISWDGSV